MRQERSIAVDDDTLRKALLSLTPKLPATAEELGAPKGYARFLKALEAKGWLVCGEDYKWRLP